MDDGGMCWDTAAAGCDLTILFVCLRVLVGRKVATAVLRAPLYEQNVWCDWGHIGHSPCQRQFSKLPCGRAKNVDKRYAPKSTKTMGKGGCVYLCLKSEAFHLVFAINICCSKPGRERTWCLQFFCHAMTPPHERYYQPKSSPFFANLLCARFGRHYTPPHERYYPTPYYYPAP